MPSQPLEAPWDFRPALELIDSETIDAGSPTLSPRVQPPLDVADAELREDRPITNLGTFSKLWERLGISFEEPLPPVSPVDPEGEDQSLSDDAVLSTPADNTPDNSDAVNDVNDASDAHDAIARDSILQLSHIDSPDLYAGMTRKQRSNARKNAIKARKGDKLQQEEYDKNERMREALEIRLASTPKIHSQRGAPPDPELAQLATQPRSNVGAKVSPATPAEQKASVADQGGPPKLDPPPAFSQDGLPTSITATPLASGSGVSKAPRYLAQRTGLRPIGPNPLPRQSCDTPSGLAGRTTSARLQQGTTGPNTASDHLAPLLRSGRGSVAVQNDDFISPPVRAGDNIARGLQGNRASYSGQSCSPAGVPTHWDDSNLSPLASRAKGRNGLKPLDGVTPALADLSASLRTQYTTVGTPVPVKHPNQSPPHIHTRLSEDAKPSTPGPTPMMDLDLIPSTVKSVARSGKKAKKVSVRTREDRDFDFLKKLIDKFPEDKKWLVAPMRLSMSDKVAPEGVHIFVDASNILIGFTESLRKRGIRRADMSFDCLALLLERRRPVAKRVYAGSTRFSAPVASNEKFNELAGVVGYEKNIYERVLKAKELTDNQKFFKDVEKMGWAKATAMHSSGNNSDPETGAAAAAAASASASSPSPTTPLAQKWVEQGVDETLHLKMCQSIIDCDQPSTMVLATGDGAQAEYSDGFLAHVERALRKGWCVELVSWKQQLSSGYKSPAFRARWGERFRIVELDEFVEFMGDDG